MSSRLANSMSVREGLVRIVSAERFSTKPRSDANNHVVIMERVGGSERHYTTLCSGEAKLSIGEQLWGRYTCYIVNMAYRQTRIADQFPTRDRLTSVRVEMDVSYRALDANRIILGGDALKALRDELSKLLRRELSRVEMEEIDEEGLERKLTELGRSAANGWGLAVSQVRLSIDWSKELLDDARQVRKEDNARRRKGMLELEDIDHVKAVLDRLGLEGHWPELRLKLLSMSREEAYEQISALLTEQRQLARSVGVQRLEQDQELIKHMIDEGILEGMDLEEFQNKLLKQYIDTSRAATAVGTSPLSLLGLDMGQPAALGSGEQSGGKEDAGDEAGADSGDAGEE